MDWSAAADRGAKPKADAVWTARAAGGAVETRYHRRPADAEKWLADTLAADAAAGRRTLAGFDFPFAYPAGFAEALTGTNDPLALWDWFAARLPGADRWTLAGEINARFPGPGPLWFNGGRADVPGLPRKKARAEDSGLPERRAVERRAPGAFTCWQLGGAGAVGSQAMTGQAALSRLRRRLGGAVAVWPFEPLQAPVALVEVWPSLIASAVRAAMAGATDPIKDEWQVRVLAGAIAALTPGALAAMLDVAAPVEGWILGVGHEAALAAAADLRAAA